MLTREQIEAALKGNHTSCKLSIREALETALALYDENEKLKEMVCHPIDFAHWKKELEAENYQLEHYRRWYDEETAPLRAENARLKECMKDMFSMEDMDAAQFEVNRLTIENARLREEVHADNLLLDERNRLLKLFGCPVHGECVPYAMEQVETLRDVVVAALKVAYNEHMIAGEKERAMAELRAALAKMEKPKENK